MDIGEHFKPSIDKLTRDALIEKVYELTDNLRQMTECRDDLIRLLNQRQAEKRD